MAATGMVGPAVLAAQVSPVVVAVLAAAAARLMAPAMPVPAGPGAPVERV